MTNPISYNKTPFNNSMNIEPVQISMSKDQFSSYIRMPVLAGMGFFHRLFLALPHEALIILHSLKLFCEIPNQAHSIYFRRRILWLISTVKILT